MVKITQQDEKIEPAAIPDNGEATSDSLLQNNAASDGNADDNEEEESKEETDVIITKTKIIQTIVLYLAVFDLAVTGCMMGPSLLDLEQLTNSDTATIAMVFIGRGIGSLVGNVLAGFIIDKINYWLLIFIDKLLLGLFTILIPLCRNVPLLVLCTIPAGMMGGFSDAGSNTVVLMIWGKDNGPVVQGFHFLFGLGCMLAPLVVEPFLLKRPKDSVALNESLLFSNGSEAVTMETNSLMIDLSERSQEETQDSQVFYGYLIGGCIAFITCVCSLVLFFKSDRKIITYRKKSEDGKEPSSSDSRNRMYLWILFLFLLFAFYVSIVGLEMSLSGFMLTFSVKQLGWSKSHGALVTSVFLGAFTVGRGLGVFVIRCVSPTVLLLGDLLVCVIFSLVMVIFVNMHVSVLWICAVGLGIGVSTMFATGFTWTERYIGVNPKATSVILVGAAVGEIGGPVIVGQLFDRVAMMSFAYVVLFFSLSSIFIMVTLRFVAKKVKAAFSRANGDVTLSGRLSAEET